ncbi:MAG: Na-translocating system protein MpsB, partial [Alphaproteobacteria bacterium]|nr:Na-translocating system protein MpsB [Alphaproteobacteria bacterium]
DTNSDRIALYDVQDVPSSFLEDLSELRKVFQEGGEQQALNRCDGIPGAPTGMTAKQAYAHVEARGFDWANPRPEWGLSGNAGFIIGRRGVTKGVDLGGRCFLHSYNAISDPQGAILEKVMTAPLVVGEWINMEHYFSSTDPWNYGSGSKVIHNVVAGVGLMYGAESDLATGLPLQTMNNGEIHNHEPMRLLTIIEAKTEVIAAIISRHEVLQHFFHNEWVNLVALDPLSSEFHRYNKNATWELIDL